MMKVQHGGYIIEVFSYRSGGYWRPDIRISRRKGAEVRTEHLSRLKTPCSTHQQSPTRTGWNSPGP